MNLEIIITRSVGFEVALFGRGAAKADSPVALAPGLVAKLSPKSPEGAAATRALRFPSPLRGLHGNSAGFPGAEAPGYLPWSLRDHPIAQLQET